MAGSVSEAVAGVQEAVTDQIIEAQEAALENSAAQIAVAERTAQAANDALLMTELGRRVETVEREMAECRNQNLSLRTEVQELAARVAQPQAPAVIVDNSSTQQPRSPASTEPPIPAGIDPAEQEAQPESAAGGGPEKTASRPKRRLL